MPISTPQSTTLEKILLMFYTGQRGTCGHRDIPNKPTILETSKHPHPRRMLGMARRTTGRQLRTVIRPRQTQISPPVLILPSPLLLPTSRTPQMRQPDLRQPPPFRRWNPNRKHERRSRERQTFLCEQNPLPKGTRIR